MSVLTADTLPKREYFQFTYDRGTLKRENGVGGGKGTREGGGGALAVHILK